MKKPKPRKPHNLDALLERQALLYGLRDFRYGQLLSPNESTELAQEISSSELQGWTLRSAVASEEIDWFRDERDSQLLITDAPTIQEDPQSSFHHMVQAGLLVMVDEPEVYGTGDEPTEDIRIFMMARQQNAHDIVMLFHRVSDDAQVEMGKCLTNLLVGAVSI